MKLYDRFSAKLSRVLLEKIVIKKLLTTAAVTLLMTTGLWVYSAIQENPSPLGEVAGYASPARTDKGLESVPRGLSRQRKDFDKALGILENAASDDERFTGYLARVQKRVRGEASAPESSAAVNVISVVSSVKRDSEGAQPAEMQPFSAAEPSAASPQPARPQKIWAKLKDFFGGAKTDDARRAYSSQPASAVRAAAASDAGSTVAATRLIVGDVRFAENPAIERWVNYYTASQGGRQTMQIGINRSASYLDLARAEFRRLGVPEDLVWLAHVESVWHPTAASPAAAGGLWQFIPRTATDYGLTVSQEYDERLDPAKQTRVAATYLRDLYTIFGDWSLAMAAYNCGEPRVMDAIVKNGGADFWEIHEKQLLPRETLNYVPKILAAIEVAGQAENYGFMPEPQVETPAAADWQN